MRGRRQSAAHLFRAHLLDLKRCIFKRIPTEKAFFVQVLNVTRPSPGYLAGGFGSSHSLVLHSSEDAFSSNVNCTEQADRVTYEEGDYPTLEAMVCSVVRRGDAWIPEENSGDPSEGSGSSVMGDDSNSSGLRGSRAAHTITAFLVGAVIVTASLIF